MKHPALESVLDSGKGKFVYFKEADEHNPNSWIVEVRTSDKYDVLLGVIKYYAHWRQYAFYPEPETVFEKTCQSDILGMTGRLNELQRAGVKPTQEQEVLN